MSTESASRTLSPAPAPVSEKELKRKRKRSRDDAEDSPKKNDGEKKHKKKRKDEDAAVEENKEEKKSKKSKKKTAEEAVEEDQVEATPKKEKEKKEKKDKKDKDRKREHIDEEKDHAEEEATEPPAEVESPAKATPSKEPKLKKSVAPEEPAQSGHALILQKLRRSLAIAGAKPAPAPAPEPEIVTAPAVEATGLEPVPQPEPTKASKPISTLSALPSWLKEPISVSPTTRTPFSSVSGLSQKLQQRLATLSLTEAFAVQTAVLPLLLDAKDSGDLCISAATGSGKTLSYVLPIVQSLTSRVVTRLRAIIVVPTRELVQQVNSTAVSISSGTGLKIGTAIGSRSLAVEQGLLVGEEDGEVFSKVDILVTTPGRLVEHVRATPGFDLTWVKWLVIDEADRLLAQSFQEWVDVVIVGLEEAATKQNVQSIAGVDLGDLGLRPDRRESEKVRKVVLSATMTRDVGKLAGLRLRKPRLIVVEDPPLPEDIDMGDAGAEGGDQDEELEQFSIPAGLREHVTSVENIEYKPLYLMYLLRLQKIKSGVLVFVKSNEGAARLAKLLETVGEKASDNDKMVIELVTGEMEKKRREKVLKRFSRGEVDMFVPRLIRGFKY
jgi:ATP-dependent RNA helicase DDX51/DBP6